MMKMVLTTAALAALASPAMAAVIDFNLNPLPGSAASYTEQGVTFTPFGGGTLTTGGLGATPNTTFGIIANPATSGNFPFLVATIAGGTNSVSVDIGDFNADQDDIFLRAYTAGNVLLGQSTFSLPAAFSGMQTLSVSFANIAYVQFGGVGVSGSSVYADNFTWNRVTTGAVPEPASWALMLAGFGIVGGALRRRQRVAVSYG